MSSRSAGAGHSGSSASSGTGEENHLDLLEMVEEVSHRFAGAEGVPPDLWENEDPWIYKLR